MATTDQTDSAESTKTDNDEKYCFIRWADDDSFDVINEKFRQSSRSLEVNGGYRFNVDGKVRPGLVLGIGSKKHCKMLYENVVRKPKSESKRHSSSSGRTGPSYETHPSDDLQAALLGQLLQMLMKNVRIEEEDRGDEEIHKIKCNGCGNRPIAGDRYKCLQCTNMNLCGGCFESRVQSKEHKTSHRFVRFIFANELFGRQVTDEDVTVEKLKQFYADEVHESITCDGCQIEQIVGLRFKCDSCGNYDQCYDCAMSGKETKTHQAVHPMVLASRQVLSQISVDDIELQEKLGSGAFGSVHKARWISKNRTVACKIIQVANNEQMAVLQKSFLKEISAYMEVSGSYILKTYAYAAVKQDDKRAYMIISEFMSRGSLSAVLKGENKLSFRRKVHMARQVASGLRKIHEHQMIHRDIRSDNILVNQNYNCKVGDMGIARVVDPFGQHTQIGCKQFMPPEFHEGSYDQKLDIFTFGLTLNEIFTETEHCFRPLAEEKILFRKESPIFQELIGRCTSSDPKYRPTAIEIEKTLELYAGAFDQIVLKKNPAYVKLSTEEKDKVFIDFYEKFHDTGREFIYKKFPAEFLNDPEALHSVRVAKEDELNQTVVACKVQ